jgi:hypothetical protein
VKLARSSSSENVAVTPPRVEKPSSSSSVATVDAMLATNGSPVVDASTCTRRPVGVVGSGVV